MLTFLLASAAHAACTVTLTSPASGTVQASSPLLRWTGDCTSYRVQESPSSTFPVVSTVNQRYAATRSFRMAEDTWDGYQAGAWAAGVYWRVQGRASDGTITTSASRLMTMAPDLDDDGYSSTVDGDCDDTNAAVNPGAAEVCDDGLDNDCDGTSNGCALSGTIDLSAADGKFSAASAGAGGGFAVAMVGDTNGDGWSDLLVGAPGDDTAGTDAGAAYLFYGPVSGTVSLASADAIVTGDSAGDQLGWAVGGGGDTDGDGLADVVITAENDDTGGNNAGAAYVFYGGLVGNVSATAADATLIGENLSDQFGWRATFADFDGDGIADLAVSSPDQDANGSLTGTTYVFYGPVSGTIDASIADAQLRGDTSGDTSGHGFAVGDLNGDGADDLVLGADEADDGGRDSGAAYLILGPMIGTQVLTTYDAIIVGEDARDGAGAEVAVGDWDGNGVDDLAIASPGDDLAGTDAGVISILYGPLSGTIDLSAADARFTGGTGEQVGTALVSAGDLNGDGADDLFVGNGRNDSGGVDAGAGWVLYGPFTGTTALTAADLTLVGEDAGDAAGGGGIGGGGDGTGHTLAGGEDLDGDGTPDLVIGAVGDDAGGTDAGAVYLVVGSGQ